jgi:shikimate dehydrogenase
MHPNVKEAPRIPYAFVTPSHYLFDLIYNPAETLFLHYGAQRGAHTCNGLDMLVGQAEAAWATWNR